MEEQWQKDVQNTINKARSQVTVDPHAAETMVQQKTNDLTAVTELRPEMRDRLMGMLHAASREIKHRKEEFIFREQQRIREAMARREQEMTNAALQQRPEQGRAVDGAFRFLDGRGPATELARRVGRAFEAKKIVDRAMPAAEPTMVAAAARRSLRRQPTTTSWRSASPRRRVSSIACIRPRSRTSPTPTTRRSSIRTPKSGRSSRRVARKSTVPRNSRAAARPRRRSKRPSKQPTQIEFVETPLKDVVDYLKDLHHIEIQLDSAALKEAGVDESTPGYEESQGHFAPLGLEAAAG